MIKEIEIKGVGVFKVKHDLLHRGLRPRLKTFDEGFYKEVQFNSYREDLFDSVWQSGYDTQGNEIEIRVTKRFD